MNDMSGITLQQVVYLPDWEAVPADPEAAIAYLAQWDYGEYSTDPEVVDAVYTRYGNAYRSGDYLMHRYYDGCHALFRIMEELEESA